MNSHSLSKVKLVFALCFFGALKISNAQPIRYSVTHLGTVQGGVYSYAKNISNSGHVVGFGDDGAGDGFQVGLFWSGSSSVISLGPVLGLYQSWALAVNDRGQVAGGSPEGSLAAAFVWESGTGFRYIGTLPGGIESQAVDINNVGQVVGYSNTATSLEHAFFWDATVGMLDLGVLHSSHTVSRAQAINDLGQVAGFSGVPERWESFVWDRRGGLRAIGSMAGFLSHRAEGLNAFGNVVGYASPTGGEHNARAFLWSSSGGFVNLGTLPGDNESRAFSINMQGIIVGVSAASGAARAVVWSGGVIQDLNTLIPADSGWILVEAAAINDAGQIVGTGAYENHTRAFRLDPILDDTPPVIDDTPPVISGLPAPGCTIWPPNHKMVRVATVTATDELSGLAPGSFNVTGSSNQPTNGDIEITNERDQFTVWLRAEKGRVYMLRATASDLAGNTVTKQATCAVPHDREK